MDPMAKTKETGRTGKDVPAERRGDVSSETEIGEGGLTRRFRALFREVQKEIDNMEERMEKMQEDLWTRAGTAPLLYGWTVERGKEGLPRLRSFGNIDRTLREVEEGMRKPLISWRFDEENEEVIVDAEVPGVKKEDIRLEVGEDEIEVSADTEDRKYHGTLSLPYELDPKTAVARHEDGVLHLTVKPATLKEHPKRIEIPVA